MLLHISSWQILAVALVTIHARRCLAIICYKCDSVTLPACATNLDSNSLPIEECNSAFACAMTIVDSVTYRGCSTNTPRGPEYYKTCSDNLCNKGVYPPGRLKCHQCNGKECLITPSDKPTPCVYFYETDQCYTDVIDEEDAYRGCLSDTNRTPNILSEYCDVNGCNDLPGVTSLTCSKCDSTDGRGCKMDLFDVNSASCNITIETNCSVQVLLGHERESCFLYHSLDRVVRGCTIDSGTLPLDEENFDTCDDELCNKRCLKEQKCIICDSVKDERCLTDPSSLTALNCQSAEASSCNACELTDGSVQRGCGVPSIAAGTRCNQCQGEGCNKLPFTKCYKCTSDESPNCAQWANPNIIAVENCEIAGANCISAVFSNGKTLRGCESPQLSCNGTQSSCYSCSGNFCNDGVYPAMRLQCLYCDGRNQCSDLIDKRNMQPCPQYEADDACFEFRSARGTMVRGCKSDRTMFYECLLAGSDCKLCAGSGCNMTPANQSAELRCHQCSVEDPACSWQQGDENLITCQNEVEFPTVESCYIRRFVNGSTCRGCSLDGREHDGLEDEEFLVQTCMEEGCNNKATVIQTCLQCRDNKTEENSCTTAGMTEGTKCANGLVQYDQRGCYTKIDGEFIERGCAADLHIADLDKCRNGIDCHYCQGIECNTVTTVTLVTLGNSGYKMQQASVGLLLLIFVLTIIK